MMGDFDCCDSGPCDVSRVDLASVIEQAKAVALRDVRAKAWDEGVQTALNHAIRNDDGVTLRLEHLDGRSWPNPYRETNHN